MVWPREEFGSRAFFPGQDNLEHEFRNEISDTITDLVVEGSSVTNKHVHCACCHTTQYTNNDAMYSVQAVLDFDPVEAVLELQKLQSHFLRMDELN